MNDTSINIAWAFKYPPNDLAIPFTWVAIDLTQVRGKWCSNWSIIYILSVLIKYNDIIVITI